MGKSNRKPVESTEMQTNTNVEATPFDKEAFLAQYGNVKSRAIRALYAEGKEIGEIRTMLGIKYQHVYNVLIHPLGGKLPNRDVVKTSLEAQLVKASEERGASEAA
jgi:hypothetical protein